MILHSLRHTAAAALTLAAMALAACSSEAPSPAASEETRGDVTLRLKVSTADSAAPSRTDLGDLGDQDGYEAPDGDFEKVATLRVIILHDSREVEGNRMVATDDKGNPINDNLEFKVSSNELKWVYLIANEASLPLPEGVTGYSTVSEWLYHFTKGAELPLDVMRNWTAGYTPTQLNSQNVTASIFGDQRHLPLTEVFRLQSVKLPHPDYSGDGSGDQGSESGTTGNISLTQEANLFLTRAAAKATFRFDFSNYPDNVSGVQVTAVRLKGLSQREFVFPNTTVYSPGKYTAEGEGYINNVVENNERYITSFVSPAENSTVDFLLNFTDPVDMKKPAGASETDKKLIVRGPIYFPESLSDKNAEAYTVQVQLDGVNWLTAKPLTTNILEFTDKGGVMHQAISRNTHLYIDIKFTPTEITWQAIEAPYNTVTLDPIFGLDPKSSDR